MKVETIVVLVLTAAAAASVIWLEIKSRATADRVRAPLDVPAPDKQADRKTRNRRR